MGRFVSIDAESKQIGIVFDYVDNDDKLKKFVFDKLGEQVNIDELSKFIPELQEEGD